MDAEAVDPVASERLSHARQVFTSDLSINEFAILHAAGFEPIELVMGASVYHVGYQFTGIRQQTELPVLTEATYRARWNAMYRMQAEADALGADGIVGVRLDWRHVGEGEHLEFIAVGTAVRFTAQPGSLRRP
ncbi:MAG: YbjQ family protein, partial [Mycobacteriaceae bacterium]|nr:YbjQ family protein [Mycobacteriaceae bacterium]